MSFDLKNLNTATSNSASCPLMHPVHGTPLVNEDGSAWTIDLVSSDSPEYKKAQQTVINRQLKEASRKMQLKATAEQVNQDQLTILVACTKGWSGLILDGKPLPFSTADCRKVYEEHPWIREQANSFINDRANFLGNC